MGGQRDAHFDPDLTTRRLQNLGKSPTPPLPWERQHGGRLPSSSLYRKLEIQSQSQLQLYKR